LHQKAAKGGTTGMMASRLKTTHALAATEASKSRGLSTLVKMWFVTDAIVALAPPLYWAAAGMNGPILGVPASLFYFLAVSLCITLSIIVAYLDERITGRIQP
jgi:hypothetical protein